MKPWYVSKTLWFNALAMALVAVESQLNLLKDVLPGGLYTWLAFGVPVVNAVLRVITTQALTLKEPTQ